MVASLVIVGRGLTGSCSHEHLRLSGGRRKGFDVTITNRNGSRVLRSRAWSLSFWRTIRQSNYAILTNFCIFPRNVAPDFLQYLSEDPNQRERGRGTMKWLQLAYSIISVNAAILALLAVIMNLLRRSKSRNDN